MKNYKIFFLINIFLIFSSCGSVKDAFSNQMKNSSDEFLVEKKSPLVTPPEYNELPVPKTNEDEAQSSDNKIKNLMSSQDTNDIQNNNGSVSESLDNTIIKKIKKN